MGLRVQNLTDAPVQKQVGPLSGEIWVDVQPNGTSGSRGGLVGLWEQNVTGAPGVAVVRVGPQLYVLVQVIFPVLLTSSVV